MPTYQYSCTECGAALEAQQSFSDEPLAVCPECDGRLRKVFSAVGVVFKGSGFYRTDSRTTPTEGAATSNGTSGSKSDSTKSDSGSKSDSGKPDSGKSDSGSKKSGDSSSSSTSSTTKAGSAA